MADKRKLQGELAVCVCVCACVMQHLSRCIKASGVAVVWSGARWSSFATNYKHKRRRRARRSSLFFFFFCLFCLPCVCVCVPLCDLSRTRYPFGAFSFTLLGFLKAVACKQKSHALTSVWSSGLCKLSSCQVAAAHSVRPQGEWELNLMVYFL